ncbi:MAG: uridine diphosphate-N-acetylglucosamine-binding protein YvcK [Rubrobacteridae bacterium]|nr:uridine diphosphate-N-acetylglucosamine-binding protein YvcK [Rubrobacteridae bacterium]
MSGIKVVAIGGGTGLPIALKSVREYAGEVTAIVSVADDGGSSGRLRRDMDMLPPGDIRNCLVALAENSEMAKLFKYRFKQGFGLEGHNLGNLIIAALSELNDGFDSAINEAAKMLSVNGRVLPSTTGKVTLKASTFEGEPIDGQVSIAQTAVPLKEVYLDPPDIPAYQEAVEAILNADQIIMGPGSVFTSILPNLIVPGIGKALSETKAIKIYICNAMTQPGETELFTACDHAEAIINHGEQNWIDVAIINTGVIPDDILAKLAEERRYPVSYCDESFNALNTKVVLADVVSNEKPAHHDSSKLAIILRELV